MALDTVDWFWAGDRPDWLERAWRAYAKRRLTPPPRISISRISDGWLRRHDIDSLKHGADG